MFERFFSKKRRVEDDAIVNAVVSQTSALINDLHQQIDFVQLASFSHESNEPAIRLVKDIGVAIAGKHVLIIEEIIDEGKNQVASATATLDRLRRLATSRYTDLTKTVDLTENLAQAKVGYCLNLASVRLQKIARDGGYKTHHIGPL